MLIEQEGNILLGLRADDKDFGAGIWEFPSGRLEDGETLEEAIIREGLEELDVKITPQYLVDAYTFQRKDTPFLLLTYACFFEGEIKRSVEHDRLRWVTFEEAMGILDYDKQKATLRKYFQKVKPKYDPS